MTNFTRKFSYSLRKLAYKTVKRPDTATISKSAKENTKSKVNISLTNQLLARILATGPITIADYMKEVLTNPLAGYYMNRDVFGVAGDFITSPEIGQIFGELVGIWCINEWQKLSSPTPFQLVELGPGRGTLAKDILRVLSHFNISQHFSIHLVEISPYLSEIQAQKLCFKHSNTEITNELRHYKKGETATGVQVFWYYKYEDIPLKFSILYAHEFFDALPIHKLEKIDGVWKEILIDIDPNDKSKFCYVIPKGQTPISKIFTPSKNENRNCLEYCIEADILIQHICSNFHKYGGIGLIMDYGHFGSKTDTFRAFKNHQLHDPLAEPGTADLTADVDFRRLKEIAESDKKVITFGPVDQRLFIKQMKGDERLQVLLENSSIEQKKQLISGYEMLTDNDKIGKRFKFFSIFPAVLTEHLKKFPVSGFEND